MGCWYSRYQDDCTNCGCKRIRDIKLNSNFAANSSIDIVTSMPKVTRSLVTYRGVPLTSDRGQFRVLVYQNGTLRLTNRTGAQVTPSQFISPESSWVV